jgi:hypothetical protein
VPNVVPHLADLNSTVFAMHLDLTLPGEPSLASVRRLLTEGSDRVHCQLRVSDAGLAWLSTKAIGGQAINGLCFRLETWAAGSGCVGPAAAADEAWVAKIRDALQSNWPDPRSDYLDIY